VQAQPVEPRASGPAEAAPVRQPERPLHLHELAAAARTAIRVAARDGHTSARISLQPEELGKVEIRLRYEPSGSVTAHVTAESPAAAVVLTASSGELRRSLEAQGLSVLGLDIRQGGLDLGTAPDRDRLGSPEAQAPHGARAEDDAEETTIEATRLPLAGAQVDVLA
jgi:flagellar hook-length control protein FliK